MNGSRIVKLALLETVVFGNVETAVADVQNGFLYSGGSFTTIDAPGATNAWEINDSGQIVGTEYCGRLVFQPGI